MKRLVVIMTILMLAGCTSVNGNKKIKPFSFLETSTHPTYNLSGYRPAFKDGYIDGCETAKRSIHGVKDKQRFSKDNQYRNGWKDGYNLCLGK